jgi:hypothetical protein
MAQMADAPSIDSNPASQPTPAPPASPPLMEPAAHAAAAVGAPAPFAIPSGPTAPMISSGTPPPIPVHRSSAFPPPMSPSGPSVPTLRRPSTIPPGLPPGVLPPGVLPAGLAQGGAAFDMSGPPTIPATTPRPSTIPPPVPDEADAMHFEALRGAGICRDLTEGLLMVLQERVGSKDEDTRRLDLLEHYYDANGDPATADRRTEADRMLLFRSDNGASGRAVVSALAHTHPALFDTRLERLGGEDGPLVLRCGEHLSAIDDESVAGDATVAVRSLVTAFNVLLDRCDEPRRLVPLRGDGKREIYVALEIDAAISLCLADHLEEMTTNDLVAIACW